MPYRKNLLNFMDDFRNLLRLNRSLFIEILKVMTRSFVIVSNKMRRNPSGRMGKLFYVKVHTYELVLFPLLVQFVSSHLNHLSPLHIKRQGLAAGAAQWPRS